MGGTLKYRKRGQIIIEYMLLAAMGFALLLIFTASFQGRYQDISVQQEREQLDALAHAVEQEIVLAAKVEPGYERTFKIPYVINGHDLIVENTDKQIILRTERSERTFITVPLQGRLKLGSNHIRNIDGIVCFGEDCDDLVPPAVNGSGPSGGVASPVTLYASTTEDADCRYDVTDTLFSNMAGDLIGNATYHSKSLPLNVGAYSYFVRCRDAAGNAMNASEVIIFNVA